MINNIKDTALIFEGGGMRASFSSGITNVLLENNIYFNYVAGISAGSSCVVNYVSRDIERTKKSFVDFINDPNFAGLDQFLRGHGFFNSKYIYEESGLQNQALPFDFETFFTNPAKVRLGSFKVDTGKTVYFSKKDMKDDLDVMKMTRASSTIPIAMPTPNINGLEYLDGGLGFSGGIPIDIALKEGYKKFFIVLTREKGYKKEPMNNEILLKLHFRHQPKLLDAILTRHERYNRTLKVIEQLEKEGKAIVVRPDLMMLDSMIIDYEKAEKTYYMGYIQGMRDLDKWKKFLFN